MQEPTTNAVGESGVLNLISLDLDGWALRLSISSFVLFGIIILILIAVLAYRRSLFQNGSWEIEKTELGLSGQKIEIRPNYVDKEIAYKVWVELSTRKIGIPIDLDDDVIVEIYDSWYSFFQITREMLKSVPVSKISQKSTRQIVELSIEILNDRLRPHLTKWQARFRHWYENQTEERTTINPQNLQKKFPEYDALVEDMMGLNANLIEYRSKLFLLASGGPK